MQTKEFRSYSSGTTILISIYLKFLTNIQAKQIIDKQKYISKHFSYLRNLSQIILKHIIKYVKQIGILIYYISLKTIMCFAWIFVRNFNILKQSPIVKYSQNFSLLSRTFSHTCKQRSSVLIAQEQLSCLAWFETQNRILETSYEDQLIGCCTFLDEKAMPNIYEEKLHEYTSKK